MTKVILHILERDKDFYLDEFKYPKEDERLCESICTRINYIRKLYRDYREMYPDATLFNSEILKGYYNRMRMITPNFIGDSISDEIWKEICKELNIT